MTRKRFGKIEEGIFEVMTMGSRMETRIVKAGGV
jgi:hypothetical protein